MFESYLFSPIRMKWIKGKRMKKIKGCIFCRIAKGDKSIPQKILYKDNNLIVLMNMFPYNTGHLQVIPTKHVENFDELSDEEIEKLFVMVKKCVKLLKKVLKPKGFNIGINLGGDVAGASIGHFHIHIVPRFERDFGFMEVVGKTKVMPCDIESVYKELKKEIKILE